jgi:hypothetical protein
MLLLKKLTPNCVQGSLYHNFSCHIQLNGIETGDRSAVSLGTGSLPYNLSHVLCHHAHREFRDPRMGGGLRTQIHLQNHDQKGLNSLVRRAPPGQTSRANSRVWHCFLKKGR